MAADLKARQTSFGAQRCYWVCQLRCGERTDAVPRFTLHTTSTGKQPAYSSTEVQTTHGVRRLGKESKLSKWEVA